MIKVDSLLYKIDLKLNKLSTNTHQNIPLENKILVLNEAQLKLIKQKVTGNNVTGIGLDGTRKRYEDLQNLIVPHKPLPLEETNESLNEWSGNLKSLSPEYLFYIDSYIIADKGRCKDRKIWINQDLAKHGNVSFLLNSPFYKPSFEYQETFNTITDNSINVYTDGTFTPKSIFVSYLKYPQKIDKEGYFDLEDNPSKNQDCELEEFLENELVDLAVMDLAGYTENVGASQFTQQRIQTGE